MLSAHALGGSGHLPSALLTFVEDALQHFTVDMEVADGLLLLTAATHLLIRGGKVHSSTVPLNLHTRMRLQMWHCTMVD